MKCDVDAIMTTLCKFNAAFGSDGRTRTGNSRINSAVLYQTIPLCEKLPRRGLGPNAGEAASIIWRSDATPISFLHCFPLGRSPPVTPATLKRPWTILSQLPHTSLSACDPCDFCFFTAHSLRWLILAVLGCTNLTKIFAV